MQTLIGKKIGMTRVYDENGVQVPVTVVQVGPCTVVQRKTTEKDGYEAAQIGFGAQKSQRLAKPQQGHFKKAGAEPQKVLREVRPGSIGNREWPARVFKNKKMPGQMGSVEVTTQNLRVVKVLAEDNALLLEGAVQGPAGGIVLVRKAIKK